MDFLLLSDLHLADRPPSSCTETYLEDLFTLLHHAARLAADRKVDATVWAGDVFHCKAPSRVSHRLVMAVTDLIQTWPTLVYIVPGNHDIQNHRIESVHETQPLGVLYRAGARELNGWGHGDLIYGVPWLRQYGEYTQESDDAVGKALAGWREGIKGTSASYLLVAHAPLYPPGKELEYEFFPAERWAEGMGGKGFVFYGHVHEPHGVYTAGGVTFCNNGALSRGSLHEYNLTRPVGATIWHSETGEFEFVELPHKPASEVFRLAEKQQAVDLQGRLDTFLEQIGSTQIGVVSIESVIGHVRSMGLDKSVEEICVTLLEEAATS
jgi:predicted phosphodiesterase